MEEGDIVITLSPDDSWLDAWCRTQYGMNFGGHLHLVESLPENDVNKPVLLRYVDRIRLAMKDRNFDAVEGWANALAVGAKSVKLFIPKTAGKARSEAALPASRILATQSQKTAKEARMAMLEMAVHAYLVNLSAELQGMAANKVVPKHCVTWIMRQPDYKQGGKCCGYSKSTAIKYVTPLLEKQEKPDQKIP